MNEIRYYPVVDISADGTEKQALIPTSEEDAVREHHRFWLEELVPYSFRLCSAQPQDPAAVSKFKIRCPRCGFFLHPISSIVGKTRYSLYTCRRCK